MTRLESVLKQATSDLAACGVSFALVGGLAVSARTEPRFTRDADLVVAVSSDSEAESLIHSLLQRGYRLLAQLEHESSGRLAAVRLAPPGEGQAVVVDVMFASSGIESEIVAAAEPLEIVPGLRLAVARTEHLIALKVLARDDKTRPQDLIDLRALVNSAERSQLDTARMALKLIVQRSCNRGKDLLAEFDAFLVQHQT